MQKCTNCNSNKELSAFEKYSNNNYRKICRICRNNQLIIRSNNNKTEILKIQSTIKSKICSKCNINKTVDFFNKRIRNKDGYNSICKECDKINRKSLSKKTPITEINNLNKSCNSCSYIGNNFKKNNKSSDGYYYICNNCWKPKEWTKEKQKESQLKYSQNNKEKLQIKWKKHGLNPNRRIRDSLNKRIKSCLFTKNNKTFEYIGCDKNFLKQWFEYNFEENMTFDNYGEWHIDHVKPCSSFDLTNEQEIYECFNWKNIRPCWKKDNLEKSDKIDNDLINLYKQKVDTFIKINSTTKFDNNNQMASDNAEGKVKMWRM